MLTSASVQLHLIPVYNICRFHTSRKFVTMKQLMPVILVGDQKGKSVCKSCSQELINLRWFWLTIKKPHVVNNSRNWLRFYVGYLKVEDSCSWRHIGSGLSDGNPQRPVIALIMLHPVQWNKNYYNWPLDLISRSSYLSSTHSPCQLKASFKCLGKRPSSKPSSKPPVDALLIELMMLPCHVFVLILFSLKLVITRHHRQALLFFFFSWTLFLERFDS